MQKKIFSTTNFSRIIIRSYARRVASNTGIANPGIQKRLNVLEEDELGLENVDVEEFESDFMNMGKVHREHEKELKYYREKEKYWIVKQKYFKENQINFLTWNDKEQIRYLHQSNPIDWTIEKLSEGFPALPETITKIVKSKWQIKNDTKKRHHDEAVERNWRLLKAGKLSETLPLNVINHLMKFSSREQKLNSEYDTTEVNNSELKSNNSEFSSIVSNYEKSKLRNEAKIEEKNLSEYCKTTNAKESKLKSYGKKDVTLNMIREENCKIESANIQDPKVNLLENIFNKNKLPQRFNSTENNVSTGFSSEKGKSDVISYPEKIKIPKDKYKKGGTYKVNDCYYDDDGVFLYRVPGMY